MIDTIKRGILAGIGASVTTKERLDAIFNDLVEKGKLSTDEARATADKILDEGRAEYEKACKEFSGFVNDQLHKANFATADQIQALEARIAALEAAQVQSATTTEG